MLRVAEAYAHLLPNLFSIEMWGGATFDTAMRFLKEDPWERLAQLREKVPNMERTVEAVREAGALCEAAICYTGDILNPGRPKYDLKYYLTMARELEKRGANLIAIKDMAGLCKPFAAQKLVEALHQEVGLPIHFHTHDIGGAQAASILKGAEVGLDIADGAMASMSGLPSQPSLSAIVESLRFTPRDSDIDHGALIEISRYWEDVRNMYALFESG